MSFERRTVTVEAGSSRTYDPAEWFDALVLVEQGEVDLECQAGGFARFRQGDILWLAGLPVRTLSNPGRDDAVLVAISRVPV
jgi:hypothetical protein